jgi:phage tail-like protein
MIERPFPVGNTRLVPPARLGILERRFYLGEFLQSRLPFATMITGKAFALWSSFWHAHERIPGWHQPRTSHPLATRVGGAQNSTKEQPGTWCREVLVTWRKPRAATFQRPADARRIPDDLCQDHLDKERRMATFRDRPYMQFNFLVDLGDGATDGPKAGFQEISGIGMEVTVAEYRAGNSKENSVMKITGLNKCTDVTMKRGVIGSLDLYQWLDQIRNGDHKALRTVTVQLQNEDHTEVVQTWKLLRARIIKHTSGPFNAKGTDVAMEELVLAYERLEME